MKFRINTIKKFITNILFYMKVGILGYGLKQIKNWNLGKRCGELHFFNDSSKFSL
jgi:hypothetical protein